MVNRSTTFRRALRTTLLAAVALAGGAEVSAQPAATDPQLARGRRLFLQCASCHEIADTGVTKIGPNLRGVYGRIAGSVPGYDYSPTLKALGTPWDDAQLDRWLKQPADLAPGTTMAFAGLPSADDRQAMVAFLRSLK